MPAETNAIVYARSKQPITVGKHLFLLEQRYRYLRAVASSKNW